MPSGCGDVRPATIPGQPRDYAPFVGPVCSPDGKAAIVTAYIKAGKARANGSSIPVKAWRDAISDPGDGLR